MRFKNKKVLVTGASRGIGKAIALQLASEGAIVGIHYHQNEKEAESVIDEIRKTGGTCCVLKADLGNVQEAIRLGNDSWTALNGIDYLVNNAGVSYKKHFLDTTIQDVSCFLNINFIGTFFLTQTISAKMVDSNCRGRIITITSVNALRPGQGLSAYGASKAALENVMKGVAIELAPHGITVNTIAVGAIETDINAEVRSNPELLKEVNDGIPMNRFGRPEEVAIVVCDLLSSGTYITGSSLTLDGGLLLMRGYGKAKPYRKEKK